MPQTKTPTTPIPVRPAVSADSWRLANEVADVLGGMTYEERIRAYRSHVFSSRELAVAAARLPEEMPTMNGELEWIAWNLADLD